MSISTHGVSGKEIIDLLRTKLDLPEGIIWVEVRVAVDELVKIECGYYPAKKGVKIEL